MGPFERLERASRVLRKTRGRFAVAGGVAANLFRPEPRLTRDVDLLLVVEPAAESEAVAAEVLRDLGFEVGRARQADLTRAPMMAKKTTPVVMLVGREQGRPDEGGVDILLPGMAWVGDAVARAQHHLVDFGFARLPTITIEDFIVAKAFALRDNPSRFKDMDDLAAIFQSSPDLDLVYLSSAFERHALWLPRELRRMAPRVLRRTPGKK